MRSVDFVEIEQLQRSGDWNQAGALLAAEAAALEAAGAELLVLCTNTMHTIADAITDAIGILFVHIADTTAQAVLGRGLKTVGLLATAYTMEQDFYVGRLRGVHGLDVLVPGEPDRRIVHDVIDEELCVGVIADDSRTQYKRIIADLADRGAEGILLGCTVCSSDPKTPRSPSSTPPGCTRTARSSLRSDPSRSDAAASMRSGAESRRDCRLARRQLDHRQRATRRRVTPGPGSHAGLTCAARTRQRSPPCRTQVRV